jgi:hypothetical protein
LLWEHVWSDPGFHEFLNVDFAFSEKEQQVWCFVVGGYIRERQGYELGFFDRSEQRYVQTRTAWAESVFPQLVSNDGMIAVYHQEEGIELWSADGQSWRLIDQDIPAQLEGTEGTGVRVSGIACSVPSQGRLLVCLRFDHEEKEQLVCLDKTGKMIWQGPSYVLPSQTGRLCTNEIGTLFWESSGAIINGHGEVVHRFPYYTGAALASRSEYFLVYDDPIGGVRHPPSNMIRYYKASQPEPLWEYQIPVPQPTTNTKCTPAPFVIEAVLSGDGKYLAVLGSDACIYFLQCRKD